MATQTKYPDYVTDGFHIYLWNDEFEPLLTQGKLKESEPPAPPKITAMSPRERTKLEERRKKALEEAEAAVALFKAPIAGTKSLEDVFGSEPKD